MDRCDVVIGGSLWFPMSRQYGVLPTAPFATVVTVEKTR